jgi:hypothetical protein
MSSEIGVSVKSKLDIIDEIKRLMIGMNDSNFKDEIEKELPQFVVVGAQSSGKSSVLRMISSIDLPTSSKLCTRIPCIIKMRRNDEKILKVILKNPDGTENDFSEKIISKAIKKAQEYALQSKHYDNRSNNDFADQHIIEISVFGKEQANISLIDLPGFTSISTEKCNRIEELVKKYITQPGTLVLHVVKANQDYNSILGNNFMKDNVLNNIVTVITHSDEETESLKHIPNTLETINGDIFSVLGNRKDDEDEENKFKELTYLNDFSSSIQFGTKNLRDYIEDKIEKHINIQFPKALKKLEEVEEEISKKLYNMPEVSVDLLFTEIDKVKDLWEDDKKYDYQNYLREKSTEITNSIKNIPIELIKHNNYDYCDQIDNFNDLEIGTLVSIHREYGEKNKLEHAKIININNKETDEKMTGKIGLYQTASTESIWFKKKYNTYDCQYVDSGNVKKDISKDAIYNIGPNKESILQDIEKLISNRGLRNSVFADKQRVIEKYAKQFAKNVSHKMINFNLSVKIYVIRIFKDIFENEEINISTRPSIDKLYQKFIEESNILLEQLKQSIKNIETYNIGESVFTTNEHYLTQLIYDMMEEDKKNMSEDDSSIREIYHNVRAYLKTQKKVIPEVIVKEIIRIYYHELNVLFKNILNTSIYKLSDYLNEPEKVKKDREILNNNKQIIEKVIKMMKDNMSNKTYEGYFSNTDSKNSEEEDLLVKDLIANLSNTDSKNSEEEDLQKITPRTKLTKRRLKKKQIS